MTAIRIYKCALTGFWFIPAFCGAVFFGLLGLVCLLQCLTSEAFNSTFVAFGLSAIFLIAFAFVGFRAIWISLFANDTFLEISPTDITFPKGIFKSKRTLIFADINQVKNFCWGHGYCLYGVYFITPKGTFVLPECYMKKADFLEVLKFVNNNMPAGVPKLTIYNFKGENILK